MEDFYYYNPTKILFGKEKQKIVGEEIKSLNKSKVLLHYSENSVTENNLLADVKQSLTEKGIEYYELEGVTPNPKLSLIREGIRICKENNIDFILAMGGGSTIDSVKGIAAGAVLDEDLWSYLQSGNKIQKTLAYGTILTLPASGSEMNNIAILSNEDTKDKIGISVKHPIFSILNAQLSATAPKKQVAYGVFDMFSHMVEMYFTPSENVEVIDNMLVGNMRTVYQLGPKTYDDPYNYDLYSQITWSGTMAHNYIFALGRVSDWSSHQIEHEISAYYDVAHAPGLSIVMLSWMKYVYKNDIARFAQFACDVFDIRINAHDLEETALKGILAFEGFIRSLDMPTKFSQLDINDMHFNEIVSKLTKDDSITIGKFRTLNYQDIKTILKNAL
ncbi:iron-containing alcohol dehydrogenase [Erysipelotrichaceae bacterium OttesenSCG-928-M19]|nr:iron-containing alcohol dehydrogenase [Erysipelotrichaceae bacterium OttesenSCG-928-M19]